MNRSQITNLLIKHEDIVPYVYQDSEGYWTIGIGRLVDKRKGGCLSETEMLYLLNNDIDKCVKDLSENIFHDFDTFHDNIQTVLISMRFQLGYGGFRGFKKMIAAFKAKDYQEAAKQMKDSGWYKQVQKRADELIKMVLS